MTKDKKAGRNVAKVLAALMSVALVAGCATVNTEDDGGQGRGDGTGGAGGA